MKVYLDISVGNQPMLQTLAGISPGKGKDKKTFTVTYKWIGNLEINYTAPIWLPISNDTNGRILRPIRIQFLAQRMVSPQDYLYQETKRLPIINYYTISSIV